MIEEKLAKSNLPTVSINGVSLSSLYDPLKEARQWLSGQSLSFEYTETIFLLGLGAGYHAEVLAERDSSVEVIVIEPNIQLQQWFWKRTFRQLPNLRVVNCMSEFDLRRFKKELQGAYVVLQNPYAMRLYGSALGEVEDLLLGRSERSIKKLKLIQSGLRYLRFGAESLKAGELIGIHQVEALVKENKAPELREKQIWSCLRELVK